MAHIFKESIEMNITYSNIKNRLLLLELSLATIISIVLFITFGKVTVYNYPLILIIVGIIVLPLEYVRQFDMYPKIISVYQSFINSFLRQSDYERDIEMISEKIILMINKNVVPINEQFYNSFQSLNQIKKENEVRFPDNINTLNENRPQFIYYYMGLVHQSVQDYSEAKRYLSQSLELARRNGFTYLESLTIYQLGILSLYTKNYSEALEYFKRCYELFQNMSLIE